MMFDACKLEIKMNFFFIEQYKKEIMLKKNNIEEKEKKMFNEL